MWRPLLTATLCAGLLVSSPGATPEEEVAAARALLQRWQEVEPQRVERTLHLVYWTPSGRPPLPRYQERFSAIVRELRDWYAGEMTHHRLGPGTFHLAPDDAAGLVPIHLVQGQDAAKIPEECTAALQAAGQHPEQETVLILCNLAHWDAAARNMSQDYHFYARGTSQGGLAWQVDTPLLDLALLGTEGPMLRSDQHGNIPQGWYSGYAIGHLAQNLGHALGLPHSRERAEEQRRWSFALMGTRAPSFRRALPDRSQGLLLPLADALRLASHPLFSGSRKGLELPAQAQLSGEQLQAAGQEFTFSAQVTADPPAYAVIGYLDPDGRGDTDAQTVTAVPDATGHFTLRCRGFEPSHPGVLRVVVAQVNGAMTSFIAPGKQWNYPYDVAADGSPDVRAGQALIALPKLTSDLEQAELDPLLKAAARRMVSGTPHAFGPVPAEASGNRCVLDAAQPTLATVGWAQPTYGRLPGAQPWLIAGGRLYAQGIYAHAPARHVWKLGGQWKRFSATAALAYGHPGTVTFEVRTDGKVRWRTPPHEGKSPAAFEINVRGVQELALLVEEGEDGNNSDWGLWLDPVLTR